MNFDFDMDLARQDFSTGRGYFIADAQIPIKTTVKTAGEDIPYKALVKLEEGKVKKVTAAEDEIFGIAANNAKSEKDVIVYLSGSFFADALVLEDSVTPAKVEVALRNIGIYLEEVKPDP